MERMRVSMRFFVVNTLAIKQIDTHLSGGVDDVTVSHADAYMHDTTLGVVEEGHVVALYVAQAHLVATGRLLRGVAWEPDA